MDPIVEDYNPFLIGIKLVPGISLDSIKKEMKKLLNAADGYIVPPGNRGDIGLIGLPIENIGIENIGLKDDVEIKLNLQTGSFNLIGEDPQKVKNIFVEVESILSQLPFDRESLTPFYEIMTNVGIKTDNGTPKDIINKSFDKDFSNIASEINSNISLTGIHLGSLDANLEDKDFFDITIEPKKGSISNRYYAQMRYQTKEKDNIIQFDTESVISDMIKTLEKE